ncbi:hypothetical protein PI125_g27165 [Phytophthora idaei]|nr:hypothetical protein PI125_g27165 [Phytophthora idaei]
METAQANIAMLVDSPPPTSAAPIPGSLVTGLRP